MFSDGLFLKGNAGASQPASGAVAEILHHGIYNRITRLSLRKQEPNVGLDVVAIHEANSVATG